MDGVRVIIMAGALIDGSGAQPCRNVCLMVEDGLIAAVAPAASMPPPDQVRVVDLSHCVLLPPLVDCSILLSRSPALEDHASRAAAKDAAAGERLLARHLAYCHAHGVLGLADGGDGSMAENAGAAGGPVQEMSIRTAGPVCRSPADGAAWAQSNADFLRVVYSADIVGTEENGSRLTAEELRLLLRGRRGKKAVVVANGERQVAEALDAGCDAIEQGYGMGESSLRRMAKRGVLWIPSVIKAKNAVDGSASGGDVCCRFSQRYVAPGKALPGAESYWKQVLADQLALLRLARSLDVEVAVGSGAGSLGILHGESVAEEMKLFIKSGFSLAEAVRCASANGARFFGMEELGPLTVGKAATFLLARGYLQQLPRKLSYLEGIYVVGTPSPFYRKTSVLGA